MKQLILRVSDDLHRRITARAAREGKSVNAWAGQVLDATVDADTGNRQARLRAKAAALGMLRAPLVEGKAVDEETRARILEELRPLGPAILRELEEGRNRL